MKFKKSNSRSEFLLNKKILNSKRSQAWGIDLMVALVIFSIGIVIFYIYSLNSPGESKENIEKLSYDGKIIANTILSEGYPLDWSFLSDSEIQKTGILSDNKINESKLEKFYELTQTTQDYQRTQRLFDTIYDYYFFLNTDMIIDGEVVEGIGKPGTDKDNIDAKNLIKVTRYTVYQDKPMTAYLYVWEE